MSKEIEDVIIQNLMINSELSRKAVPFIKKEYFTSKVNRELFGVVSEYYLKNSRLIERDIALIDIQETPLLAPEIKEATDLIDNVFSDHFSKVKDADWLSDQTETWCRDRSVYLSIIKAISVYDGSDKEFDRNAIPALLQESLAVSFDTKIGIDWEDDANERYDRYSALEDKIPFDIETFNNITSGGAARKTLNVLLAGTHVGKTMVLCHLAAGYARLGYQVLYISLEMAEDPILQRIDSNMLKIPMHQVRDIGKEIYLSRINQLKKKAFGKIKVIQFPTASAHAKTFESVMKDLEIKANWKPDVVVVDYLGIVSSYRLKPMPGQNYFYLKSVSEELRALAITQNVVLWSAGQLNRDGMKSSEVEMTDTSESVGIPFTADFLLGLSRTAETDALNQIICKQLKNRYRNMTFKPKFVLGSDFDKQLLYDVEQSEQNLTEDVQPDREEVKEKFMNSYNKKRLNFEGVK